MARLASFSDLVQDNVASLVDNSVVTSRLFGERVDSPRFPYYLRLVRFDSLEIQPKAVYATWAFDIYNCLVQLSLERPEIPEPVDTLKRVVLQPTLVSH
jgi:hypothetical protein